MNKRSKLAAILAGVMAAVLILSFVLSVIPVSAASSSEIRDQINEMEKENEELEGKIKDLQGQLNTNATEIKDIMAQKNLIDQQVGLLYTQINNLNAQIAAYNVLIADKQEELNLAEKKLAELTEKNRERIRAMEENGTLTYWSVLVEANSFFELLDRLYMVQEIAAADSRRLKEMDQAAREVEAAQTALLAERADMQKAMDEMAVIQADLENKSAQAQALLSELIAKGEEFESLMEELEEEHNNMSDQIAAKEEEYDEAKHREHMATATQPPRPTGGGNGGTEKVDPTGMVWLVPVSYTQISSPFGMRNDPFGSGQRKHHNGVDLWAPGINGKPIYASRSGLVTLAGWYGSGGWTVKIQHDDVYVSIYMHMTNFIVSAGDYVSAGQVIGYVGTTGGSTGPHLHFEIRQNGVAVNPMNFIG